MANTVGYCCKNCTERHYKCHSSCEKYIKSKAEYEEQKSALRKQKQLEDSIFSVRFKHFSANR